MIVGLTGTPGTGKSTVSSELRSRGKIVYDLNEVAIDHQFVLAYDKERQTYEMDLSKLNKYLVDNIIDGKNIELNDNTNINTNKESIIKIKNVYLDGHISHLLDVTELVVILRCHPEVLRQRLKAKSWNENKIRENLEAEALDVITIECIEKYEKENIFEIDTTKINPERIAEIIIEIISGNGVKYEPGNIDWSEEILKWY